ncbi:unannotated protein [freshwater metagenome]|uniref:Unannotated protein n=1 Tax=freshwater metagenome TaxID=449393 RepID=A0A6J7GD77_9ZZZZ|nr:hypothetical protein [Actinomycetota bacterium]MSY79116.1 hypothetical protein [Actinomycetota bacterium]
MADDEQMFAELSLELAQTIDDVLVDWVVTTITNRAAAANLRLNEEQLDLAARAGEQCRSEVSPKMRALLITDLDAQQSTPLALLRSSTSYATQVLQRVGVPPVRRDEFEQRAFPDDIYALAPASFNDVDERLQEPGLLWGAAKAHLHLQRRRKSGQL